MNQNPDNVRPDTRNLSPDMLAELRRRVVAAVESGAKHNEVARLFGISRQTVGTWVRAYRRAGDEAFRPAPPGRRRGEQLALSSVAQLTVIRTICRHTPDQVGLRYRLWTRQAVGELINREFRVTLGTATVGNYLIRWGISVDNHALHNLRLRYAAQTVPHGATGPAWMDAAEVLWVTWRRPEPALVIESGPHESAEYRAELMAELAGLSVLFAVSNRGAMYFQFVGDHRDGRQTRSFLQRLTEQVNRRANIVTGWQPSRMNEDLNSWLAANADSANVRFVSC